MLVTGLFAVSVAGCGPAVVQPGSPPAPRLAPAGARSAAPVAVTFPVAGKRKWRVAPGSGRTVGRRGTLLRYRIVVEEGITGVTPGQFASEVTAVLSDRRSWTAGGRWRMRRVGPGEKYDFIVHLATPATRDRLCRGGYDRYTSCRDGDRVVLNVARWRDGVPHWRAPLKDYRAYLVNHEVGHRLHQGHELCPEAGGPAPVMQQQTLGLHGCEPNGWPYPNGAERWTGPAGAYDDPLPSS